MTSLIRTVVADRGDAGRRLDHVLRRHLGDDARATRTRVQQWIADGHVLVNGVAVRRAAARAASGDILTVRLHGLAPRAAVAPEEIALQTLYEDTSLIAIDKPAGMVVHPSFRHAAGTLLNALTWRARDWPPAARPSIVGRLDRLTSGVVIAAKSAAMHAALQRALTAPDAEKAYLAVVYGRMPPTRGQIDLRLAKAGDRRRVIASADAGAPSLTRFERLARVAAPRVGLALVRCTLVTGRAHQIRAHMAARGWPLVGDPVYGEPRWRDVVDPTLADALRAFPRQALHARRVAFVHPITKARTTIDASLPYDFSELLRVSGLDFDPRRS
jgi:23S rRNA pseudouridine1911/1915/1917 synthase